MKPKLHQKAGRVLRKASPTILTCIGAVGVVATAVLAVKATPKALRLIEIAEDHRHDDDPNWTWSPLTKTEIIKTTWKCYVPAVVTGAATIICIFGANTLNRRQQASLASAYALLNRSYNDYKRKLKELYGKEAHDNIMKALAVEKADKVDISAWNFCSLSSLEFEGAEEEERLFYDPFSKRYFQSTIGRVLQAEYHLNRNFALMGGCIGVSDFYEMLGLEPVKELDCFGWWVSDDLYWVDFNHVKTVVDDGLNGEIPCYIVEMVFEPTNQPPD